MHSLILLHLIAIISSHKAHLKFGKILNQSKVPLDDTISHMHSPPQSSCIHGDMMKKYGHQLDLHERAVLDYHYHKHEHAHLDHLDKKRGRLHRRVYTDYPIYNATATQGSTFNPIRFHLDSSNIALTSADMTVLYDRIVNRLMPLATVYMLNVLSVRSVTRFRITLGSIRHRLSTNMHSVLARDDCLSVC